MRLRVPFVRPTKSPRWRSAAASGWRARIALLVITLVAAAGAAYVCTPNKHTEAWLGCRGSWVVASAMKAIRHFFCRAVADLLAAGKAVNEKTTSG
jgi:ABC-type Co2+ transport system permease subunit